MTARLDLLMRINPDFATALQKGEPWALKHADAVRGLDGQASRRHPERAFKEDGHTRRNWCGTCAFKGGCVICDLDGDHVGMKGHIEKYDY